jgi:P pilus assembly chaperone PapD
MKQKPQHMGFTTMKKLILSASIFILLMIIGLPAEAKIDILPRRVVIEGRNKSGEITILNLGTKPMGYRIGIINYRQDEKGVYTLLNEPLNPAFDPEKYIRLSPRQFTLPVGGRQKIRFSVRPPADLPEGEYRFHVAANSLAPVEPGSEEKRGAAVGLRINLGVSIPVVYRHGNLSATAKIIDAQWVTAQQNEQGANGMNVTIGRQGNSSTIGLLEVYWTPNGGTEEKIGYVVNANVFIDVEKRSVFVPMKSLPSGSGTVRIRYLNDIGPKKGAVYDEIIRQQ